MRSLVYFVATTVDGYISGGPTENPDFFPFDGPQVPDLLAEFPEMLPMHVRPHVPGVEDWSNRRFDTCLQGRNSYQIGLDVGVTSPYAHLRQLVFSRTLTESPDPAVELVRTDPVARVRELKAEDGMDLWLCGGGELATVLADEIDELILKVSPVLHGGGGVPLFASLASPRTLVPTGLKAYENGFQLARYRWA